MTGGVRAARAAWLPLVLIAVPFLVRPELIGGDEPHYAAVASSLATDFDFDPSNQYAESAAGVRPWAGSRALGKTLDEHLVEKPAGRVPSHPIGMPTLAAPLLAVGYALGAPGMPDLLLGLLTIGLSCVGFLALAAIAGEALEDRRAGRWVAAITWFSTPLWFYGRTFFTEPWLAGLLLGAIWLVLERRVLFAGLVLGAAFFVKEPALIPAAGICAWAVLEHGGHTVFRLLPGMAASAAAFIARNGLLYGSSWIDFPQRFQLGSLREGAVGLALDPARGLLWFAPVTVFALLLLRRARPQAWAGLALGCFLGYYALNAAWIDWRGGSGFGQRLLVPVLPLLAVPVALAWREQARRPCLRIALCAVAGIGIAVEVVAITSPFRAFWSPSIDDLMLSSPSRIATGLVAMAAAFAVLWRATRPDNARARDGQQGSA